MKRWRLNDIIIITLISILCGLIFWGADFVYNGIAALLTPVGLRPLANEITIGIWIFAGTLSACIFQRPGAALLGDVISAVVETILGSQWGVMNLITGAVQGIGSEAGLALTGYRHYDGLGMVTAAVTGTIVTFGFDLFNLGYDKYSLPFIGLLIATRLVSLLVISGWLPLLITKLLNRSRGLNSIRK